jgi:hypothetical protein
MSNFGMGQEQSRKGPIGFFINPLLAEIVRWNDVDICDIYPKFRRIEAALRVNWICSGLAERGVATLVFGPTVRWVPTEEIESASGGSDITDQAHYSLVGSMAHPDSRRFKRVMEKNFDRRLDVIITTATAFFQNVNAGFVIISGADTNGLLRYNVTQRGRDFLDGLSG